MLPQQPLPIDNPGKGYILLSPLAPGDSERRKRRLVLSTAKASVNHDSPSFVSPPCVHALLVRVDAVGVIARTSLTEPPMPGFAIEAPAVRTCGSELLAAAALKPVGVQGVLPADVGVIPGVEELRHHRPAIVQQVRAPGWARVEDRWAWMPQPVSLMTRRQCRWRLVTLTCPLAW